MKTLISFLAGTVVGATVAVLICKSSTKEKLMRQAEELHAHYKALQEPQEEQKPVQEETNVRHIKPELMEKYQAVITKYEKYNNDKTLHNPEVKVQTADTWGPYPIDEDKVNDDNLQPTWYYHSNGVLVDANGEPLNDEKIDQTIGLNFKDYFGEVNPEDYDTIYVRNEKTGCDYEICYCEEEYVEPSVNGYCDD